MMKTIKKFLLSVFVVLTVFTCVLLCGKFGVEPNLTDINIATTAFAATQGYYTYIVDEYGEVTIIDVKAVINGKITIPAKFDGYPVVSIGEGAFNECENLKSIIIPDTVSSIGDSAFSSCVNLENVTLGNSVKSIGYRAFFGCSSLVSITIPDSVTTIGDSTFYGCSSLENITIGRSVTRISDSAFYNCQKIEYITIPSSVVSIEKNAFAYCKSLESITIPDSVTSIDNYAFYDTAYYNNTENWSDGVLYIGKYLIKANADKIPNSYAIKNGTKIIADAAFYDCYNLESIIIPDSVITIGASAFYNCKMLNDMTMSDSVTSIGDYAFYYCWNLCGRTLPDSLISIGDYAFYSCLNLSWIEISDSVISIGDYAFSNTSLQSIIIPDSVISIGDYTFYNCFDLIQITISDSVTSIGVFAFSRTPYYDYAENWSNGVLYIGNHLIAVNANNISNTYVIKKGTKAIAASAFYYCLELESITIPDSVTAIGASAFYYCLELESITIPDSVTVIGDSAFYYCQNLRTITIPDSVTSIGNSVFTGCIRLESVTIPDSLTSIGNSAFAGCSSIESITIPASITSIGDSAFAGCGIESITIPSSVINIGDLAFAYCDNLKSINVNKKNKYYSSDSYGVLFNKNKTKLIQYPIGTSRASYVVPSTVVWIGRCSFARCYSIDILTLPGSVMYIDYCAFDSTLLSVVICYGTGIDKNRITIGEANRGLLIAEWRYACENSKHTYTNSCDETCDRCEERRTISHTYDNACDKTCNVCSATRTITHTYKTTTVTKATLTANGKSKTSCAVCGYVKSTGVISYPKTFTLSATSYTYNGKARTPAVTVKDAAGKVLTKGTDYTVTYSSGRTSPGTYKVTVTMKGSYTGTKTLTFKIKPIDISTCKIKLSNTSYTYDGKVKAPTVTITNASGTKLTKGTSYTVTYASGRKNAGTYNVTVKMIGNYTGTKTLSFKIKPIDISTCKIKLSNTSYTFDGKVKAPTVTVTNSYGTKLTKGTHYTVSYSEGRKTPGTYNVTVKMKGNYTGTKPLSFKINPINISTCKIKLSNTSYTFDGKVKAPTVTVTNSYGTKLTKGTHYTVSYSEGRKTPGTYNVTVKMKGNYTGTKTLSFRINPINISTCKVKLSATSFTYDGKVKAPTVTVTNSYNTKLTKGTHYTVTYQSGRTAVGTYKVTIKMIGNYTGTKTLTFKINPPKTTVAALTSGTKSITVNLTKKTTQVTGYQIQYSTSKDFTNAKTKTLTSYSTVKTTLSNLTASKTYYVRVRTYKTVNDVKYYSGWSAYKYVKTK